VAEGSIDAKQLAPALLLAELYQQFVGIFSGEDASAGSKLFQILGIAGFAGMPGLSAVSG
jgi:hypothetical protein